MRSPVIEQAHDWLTWFQATKLVRHIKLTVSILLKSNVTFPHLLSILVEVYLVQLSQRSHEAVELTIHGWPYDHFNGRSNLSQPSDACNLPKFCCAIGLFNNLKPNCHARGLEATV